MCIKNDGYLASLEVRKVYVALPDAFATKHGMIRVVDESGEDYLFPKDYFDSVRVSQTGRELLLSAA
jgi:hypothetical protein